MIILYAIIAGILVAFISLAAFKQIISQNLFSFFGASSEIFTEPFSKINSPPGLGIV